MGSAGASSHVSERVLVLGNNRIANSIIHALATATTEVHQTIPEQSTSSAESAARVHHCNLSLGSLTELFRAIKPDLVISTTGGGSYDFQKSIIDSALDAGVRYFLPAEFGNDCLNEPLQLRLPPLKERAKVVSYLRNLSDQGRIEWIGVATGCQLDHGLQSGNLGFDLKWQSATVHGRGDEHFAGSSTKWIGHVVSKVLERWDDAKNQYLYAAGFITTANEVLRCLEQSTGKQWEGGRGDVEDCVREAERRMDRGFPDAGMFLMERSVLYDEGLGPERPFVEQHAMQMLGLERERVEDVVKYAVHEHKHRGTGDCGCS